jgi:thiol:disulfide interchange protein
MFRSILGFAILAVAVWLALKIVFGLMGTLIGLVVTLLWLAAVGYVVYLVLRVVSPNTAAKVRGTIKGWPRIVV